MFKLIKGGDIKVILKEVELFYTTEHRYLPNKKVTIIKLENVLASETEGWLRFTDADYEEESYTEPLQKFIDSKQVLWVSMDSDRPLPVVISENTKMSTSKISMDLKVVIDIQIK
jgi:hypothetical protein